MKPCPLCQSEARKVIFLALPMLLCSNENCNCLFGFFARVAGWFPIGNANGEFVFLAYTGHYRKALWHWLLGDVE